MYDMKSNYFLSMVLATCVIVSGCSSVEKRTLAPDKKTNLLEITNTPETTNTPEITQKSDIEERKNRIMLLILTLIGQMYLGIRRKKRR